MESLEGPNTQDEAERFMAATGHHLEDVMATCHPPGVAEEVGCAASITQWAFRQFRMKQGVELHQRDLSSVFTTVGDVDTPWHPHFFSPVTFENDRLSVRNSTTKSLSNDWEHHLTETDDPAIFVMLHGGDHNLDIETRPSLRHFDSGHVGIVAPSQEGPLEFTARVYLTYSQIFQVSGVSIATPFVCTTAFRNQSSLVCEGKRGAEDI